MRVEKLDQILDAAKQQVKRKIAVAAAADVEVLETVSRAESLGLAEFVLVGSQSTIKEIAAQHNLHLNAEIRDEKDPEKAVEWAVDLVSSGAASALMKGMIHSSAFLKAVLNKEKRLNTGRHITQVSVLENDDGTGLRMITDCAISVTPDLMGKKEILENAVDLAHKLGYELPRVAVLASLEVINPAMQDTLDAAALSKMADRGQIKGCLVDGPFAFDNAISPEAAAHKGLGGPVAGKADILVIPNLTVGNTLTKAITYLAKKRVASATVGAAVPIVFTSRTDSIDGKLLSIALAAYVS